MRDAMTENLKELVMETMPSPIGDIVLIANGSDLCGLEFGSDWERTRKFLERHYPDFDCVEGKVPENIRDALERYFNGELNALYGIPVAPRGTEFQKAAWSELCKIPPGETITYGEQARRLGKPKAMRAVGLANGKNPIGIVVPCHRVVGINGKLTGYAGGLERKEWLLRHENALPHDSLF